MYAIQCNPKERYTLPSRFKTIGFEKYKSSQDCINTVYRKNHDPPEWAFL